MNRQQTVAILNAAAAVAYSASKAQVRHRGSAYVDWSAIHDLRRALLAAGIGEDQGWQFPITLADLAPGYRRTTWDDRVEVTDQWGNRTSRDRLCDACRRQAQWVGPDQTYACDVHATRKAG